MKKLLSALLIGAAVGSASAQSSSVTGVKSIQLQNMNAITENNVVQGYYAFCYMDKASKKENLYSLNIFDNNMTATHQVDVTMPNAQLLESSFNGEKFCFSFLDVKNKAIRYQLFSKEGKKEGAYTVSDLSRNEIAYIQQMTAATSEDVTGMLSGSLAAVPGKGFIRYGWEKEKGYHVVIEMFDNTGKKKWSTTSGVPATQKSYESAFPFYVDGNVAATYIFTRANALTMKDMDYFLTFTNIQTGKEIFRLKSNDGKFMHAPVGVSYDEKNDEYFVYGEYLKKDDNPFKDRSLGLYVQIVDATGKVKKETNASWAGDIAKATRASASGKFDPNYNIAVHSMFRTVDGKIFAIGEQFKKAADAGGIALTALALASGSKQGPGVALVKIQLQDMMVFEFNPDLSLDKVDIVEKKTTNVHLPQGMGIYPSTTIGFFLKMYGGFDYVFSSMSPDKETFNSVYVNYDKEESTVSGQVIGAIAYSKDHKIVTDKVAIEDKPTYYTLAPAKPGYVAVFEYFRKQRKLDVRLEKLNL